VSLKVNANPLYNEIENINKDMLYPVKLTRNPDISGVKKAGNAP